jgi:hypothetical protein
MIRGGERKICTNRLEGNINYVNNSTISLLLDHFSLYKAFETNEVKEEYQNILHFKSIKINK